MRLTLVFLVVIGASLCVTGAEMKPGLVFTHTDKSLSLYHQEFVLGEILEERLKNISIPTICGNLSTIFCSNFDFNLTGIEMTSYKPPKAKVNISSAEGIYLVINVPMLKLVGYHEMQHSIGSWELGEWVGNFTLKITELKLTMKREIVLIEKEKRRWVSSGLSGSIEDVEVRFNDPSLNTKFALTDLNLIKKLVLEHLFEACKNLTEVDIDYSYKLTEDIYYDMSLATGPVIGDGVVEFHHRAEARFVGDDSKFDHEPLELVPIHPNKTLYYRITDFFFNSLGYVVHKHNVLSCNFTKEDLPENNKQVLDTTCEKGCFGNICPEAAKKFPDSSIEIDMSITAPPYVHITPESFKGYLEFNLSAKARKGDKQLKDVFHVKICLTTLINLSFKGNNLRFSLQLLNSNVTVIDSKIGEVPKELILSLVELVFEKRVTQIIEKLNLEGLDLKLPELLKVSDYELKPENGDITVMVDFMEIPYMNPDKSSVRDLDSRPLPCD